MAAPASATNDRDVDLEKQSSQDVSLDEASGNGKTHREAPVEEPPAAAAEAEARPDESKPAPPSFANVPDGGVVAWTQVACSYFLFFNTWGILNTFGAYQTYYESGDLFAESSANIAWIGTLQAAFVMLIGALSGPLYDQGYMRPLLIVGGVLVVLGNMMLSLCHEFWQCVLAQGFCIGIGAGCLFVPGVAILPTYFRKHLGLAVGIAASGSSMGGIIYPIVLYRLITQIGFGWSTRVLGFIALATLLLPIVAMKQRFKPPRARALFDASALTDLPYITFTIGCALGFTGLYVSLFYISFFGAATGIVDESLAFYLVPILNAASVFGRTIPNWLSDKTGALNIMTPCAFIFSVLVFCFIGVQTKTGIIVVTILIGFFSGVYIALPSVIFVYLTEDKSKVGTRIGMGFTILVSGVLLGGPGGGGVLGNNAADLDWTALWIYAGVFLAASAVVFMLVRWMKVGLKLKAKV